MALIICPECGNEFSDKATACPNCACTVESIKQLEKIEALHLLTESAFQEYAESEWTRTIEYRKKISNEIQHFKKTIKQLATQNEPILELEKQLNISKTELNAIIDEKEALGLFGFKRKKELDEQIRLKQDACSQLNAAIKRENGKIKGQIKTMEKRVKGMQNRLLGGPPDPKSYRMGYCLAYEEKDTTDFFISLSRHCIRQELERLVFKVGPVNAECFSSLTGFQWSTVSSAMSSSAQAYNSDFYIEKRDGIDFLCMRKKDQAEQAVNHLIYQLPSRNFDTGKNASVVGRALAGAVIAGPAGAIVGALSAVDKNNKKH